MHCNSLLFRVKAEMLLTTEPPSHPKRKYDKRSPGKESEKKGGDV